MARATCTLNGRSAIFGHCLVLFTSLHAPPMPHIVSSFSIGLHMFHGSASSLATLKLLHLPIPLVDTVAVLSKISWANKALCSRV